MRTDVWKTLLVKKRNGRGERLKKTNTVLLKERMERKKRNRLGKG